MAITNYERVGKAMELLRDGLRPFVERELKEQYSDNWFEETKRALTQQQLSFVKKKGEAEWDAAMLLGVLWQQWNDVFRNTLGHAERSIVSELREARNKWAHQRPFSTDDAYRVLDSIGRLLAAVSAPQADEVDKMKMELLRLRFDEQVRGEKRKAASSLIETAAGAALPPWRDVITPHKDVATGRYQQAEFAADLWQVHLGEGSDEYRKPAEFFRRTFLTTSLKQLLVNAVQRVSGTGGDPVVQLQTNFGGGKTHSMLALYHLFAGSAANDLPGVDEVMADAGVSELPKAKTVVLVGTKISPSTPSTKPDGTIVRTLWGELAYQLGGKKAFKKVAADDANATSPGDIMRELLKEYGPAVILIDEWVAYARQLHDQSNLPAGGFETQFSFAQALTESAKLAGNCLLVISLPASDTGVSPHAQADDTEVGGVRGREALDRLRNVIGRLEAPWRPATAEESFEIVRRRLFEPLTGNHFKTRDVTARAFADLYRAQHAEFPPECHDIEYETRLKAAYPIHPEIFDRLYSDWSTLLKFQRTRGVLRLMASVIHSLWEKGDRNPLILPSLIPIDDPRVQFELTRYLSDNWVPVIEKDVDGPNSLPRRIDGEVPNLGKLHATRRVARTIYLGSAPTAQAAHRGLEDRRVKLGCVMPGEPPAIFVDALRRLAAEATYLYQDGPRVWYSTQPTVTKLAEDRAEQLKRDPDKVISELERRLRKEFTQTGEFARVHVLPRNSADVPDDLDARLVVLGIESSHNRETGSVAEIAAKDILENRGNTPRIYRNTLVFLAADKIRLQDLDEATRKYLAWESILDEKEALDLSPFQVKSAETQTKSADTVVTSRVPETYQWLFVPTQRDPQSKVEWQISRLSGGDNLAARASRKLVSEELLLPKFGGNRLRMELDRVPLWRGNHVPIRQLVEDFARYNYLPRVADPIVLINAVRDGLTLLTWTEDSFAYAESYDESAGRYRGLRGGKNAPVLDANDPGLLVKPEIAREQLQAETRSPDSPTNGAAGSTDDQRDADRELGAGEADKKGSLPRRFHGSVELDPERAGRDASQIADEVIAHLTGLVGADVKVVLEIEATIPGGASEQVVRTVTENCKALKFGQHGFEKD
jgi:predicted AAA+ superfamily ATPase